MPNRDRDAALSPDAADEPSVAATRPPLPPAGRRSRLFIAGLGIGQIVSWGSLYYSFPQLAEAMRNDLGWSKSALYGTATLGLLVAAVAAYPIGAAIDRGHGRSMMALGSAVGGLLLLAWAQVQSLASFDLIYAGVGLVQAMTLYEPAFAVIARRYGRAARSGITELTLWGGFASTIFVPVTELLIDQFGWRGALVALAAINLGIGVAIHLLVIHPGADPPQQTQRAPGASSRASLAGVLRSRVFWGLLVAFTAYYGIFTGLSFHLYPLLLERGFDASTVVAAIAIIGPAQVAGRLALWLLAPQLSALTMGWIIVLAFPVALIALWLPANFGVIALFAVIYGAANGIMTILRGVAVPELLTREAYGAINGALALPSTLAKALAPAAAAMLWSLSGSYLPVVGAAVVGAMVMAMGFCLVAMPKPGTRSRAR